MLKLVSQHFFCVGCATLVMLKFDIDSYLVLCREALLLLVKSSTREAKFQVSVKLKKDKLNHQDHETQVTRQPQPLAQP